MDTSRNLAARMGRWSARHRKTAVLGWLAFVALALVLGGRLPSGELTRAEQLLGAPAEAQRILDASGWEEPAVMQLLGEANWYLPRWLRRLPALRHEAAPAASGSVAVPRPRSTAEEPLVLSND